MPCVLRSWLRSQLTKVNVLRKGLKYAPILGYVDIDGWLSIDEAIEIYDLAQSLPIDGPVVVEIGSWLGKSSLVLAKGLIGKHSARLFCIDPFNADGDPPSALAYRRRMSSLDELLLERFVGNMRRNRVLCMIEILQGYSYEFAESFSRKIDLLFIDGNHDYDAVLKDFNDWSSLVKHGGFIVFHDVVDREGVDGPWRAVQEKIVDNPEWKDCRFAGLLFSARKTLE